MFLSQPASTNPITSSVPTSGLPLSQDSRVQCKICLKYFRSGQGLKIHTGKAHKPIRQDTGSVSVADTEELPSSSNVDALPFWKELINLRLSTPVVKRVPRGARSMVATALKTCIDKVVATNSTNSWEELFTFTYRILHARDDNHSNISLTQRIKNNCHNAANSSAPERSRTQRPRVNNARNIFKIVETKIGEGDLRGASQLLFSTDAVAPDNSHTLEALIAKHPAPSEHIILPDHPTDVTTTQVLPESILSAIMSFKNGSGGGYDGLTPQHLKDLVCVSVGDIGTALVLSLASSKIACRSVAPALAKYFQPVQVGFGSQGGCEAAVHATRTFLLNCPDKVLLKVDVRNAFNAIDRGSLLTQVKEHTPSLFPYLWQCYSGPSNLVYQTHLLKSSVGCQQGDPLGPAMFSLGIHPHITTLRSSFNVWYLDDGTLGGEADIVLADLGSLKDKFASIGLELNSSKCELFIPPSISAVERQSIKDKFEAVAPGIQIVASESLQLLGAPLLDESVPGFMHQQMEKFEKTSDRLCQINAHMALTLIKFCLFVPKFTYLLRCAHLWRFESLLRSVNESVSNILSKVLNVNLTCKAWSQASLPVRFGGLGIRKASEVSLPAFLSSAFSCRDLFIKITTPALGSSEVAHLPAAKERWLQLCPDQDTPCVPSSQRRWDEPLCRKVQKDLLNTSSDPIDRARLLAVFESESGHWLNALPSSSIGTLLDNTSLSLIVGLRLGVKTVQPHLCRCGEANVCELGHHGLSCRRSAGRIPRHATLNDVLRRALASANVPATLEPYGVVRSDGKRPDGVTHVAWREGKFLAWDVTCVDTLAPTHVRATTGSAGSAAAGAELKKSWKYQDLQGGYVFVPVGFETMGPWGPEAKKFIAELSARLIEVSGDRRAGSFLAQRLSLAIQRGNAACLLGTMPPRGDALETIFYL